MEIDTVGFADVLYVDDVGQREVAGLMPVLSAMKAKSMVVFIELWGKLEEEDVNEVVSSSLFRSLIWVNPTPPSVKPSLISQV